jgi:Protein of unknown function (DUF4232)
MTFSGPGRPSRRRPRTPARPARPSGPGGPAPAPLAAAITAACAGLLLLTGCASAAGTHADGQASKLPSGAPHGAPTVVPPTTPAAGPSSPAAGSTLAPAPPGTGAGPGGSGPGSTAPPIAAPPTGTPPAAGTAACTSSGLRASVGAPNGAAGSIYYPLDFRNVSGAACTLYGYPGVSFVAAPGTAQLGGTAARNSTFSPKVVTLAPGAVAHASVQVVVAQSYPASLCKPVTAHFLRVYPPGQVAPLYASLTAMTCTGNIPSHSTLGIYVVRPGANGP